MQGFSFSLLHIPAVSFIGCIKLRALKFTETRNSLSDDIGAALLIKKLCYSDQSCFLFLFPYFWKNLAASTRRMELQYNLRDKKVKYNINDRE